MEDSSSVIDPRENCAVSDLDSLSTFNSQGLLEQVPSSSRVSSHGGRAMTLCEQLAGLSNEIDEMKEGVLKRIKLETPCLQSLSDHNIERLLDDPFALNNIYEMVAFGQHSKELLKSLLLLKLRKTGVLACTLCERIYFGNYIHYLIHITSDLHAVKMCSHSNVNAYVAWKEMLDVFEDDIHNWQLADTSYYHGGPLFQRVTGLIERGEVNAVLLPARDWLRFTLPYTQGVQWSAQMKEDLLGNFEEHLMDGMPACKVCNEAYSDPADFTLHCLTFRHIEKMYRSERNDENHLMRTITMIVNESELDTNYLDHMKQANGNNPESAEQIWNSLKYFVKQAPEQYVLKSEPRTHLGPLGESELLRKYSVILDGKTMDDVKAQGEKDLVRLVEPCLSSFASLVRRVVCHNRKEKNALHSIERLGNDEISMIYQVIHRTLDQGLPYCLYCDRVFETTRKYCDHLLTRRHHDKFSHYVFTPTGQQCRDDSRMHEIVQLLLLEEFKRFQFRIFNLRGPLLSTFLVDGFRFALNSESTHFYCDSCKCSFVDFSFYIAHFWSDSHLLVLDWDRCIQPSYITHLIKQSTKDQRSRIKKEILDEYSSNETEFVVQRREGENWLIRTRDIYLTQYMYFHFERKYEVWRERQSYQRDEGTATPYNEKEHVPEPTVVETIDKHMRLLHKRAAYAWWGDETSEETRRFRSYFFTFPPTVIWSTLTTHLKKEGTKPYCSKCELAFASADDYLLHFGEKSHPYPNGMEESMAGLTMLVHIMYSEKRVGMDLDQFKPVVPLV